MRLRLGNAARYAALACMVGLAACAGERKLQDQVSNFRYDPVSPCGEILGVPTSSEVQYKTVMLLWFHRVDANHDGVLTLDEVMAESDRCFALMDSDHDGTITPLELQQYRLRQPFHAPSEAPSQRLGDNLRVTNPDMVPPLGEGEPTTWLGGPDASQIRQGLDPVMAADADADFRVTREELRAQTARKFARWDARHDGRVTAQEFIDGLLGPLRARTS